MKTFRKQILTSAVLAAAFVAIPAAQAATLNSNNFTVSVTLNTTCSVSTQPGAVTFPAYTPNQAGAVTAFTTFGVTCSNGVSYGMAFDVVGTGTVGGLTYTLTLRDSGNTADIVGNQTASGAEQTYRINGNIAGLQAGNAGAAMSENRYVVITY